MLLRHPAVHDAAVVPLPDERLGERACAALVIKPGRRAPTLAELQAFLEAAGRREVHVAGVHPGLRRLPADALAEGRQARGRAPDRRARGGARGRERALTPCPGRAACASPPRPRYSPNMNSDQQDELRAGAPLARASRAPSAARSSPRRRSASAGTATRTRSGPTSPPTSASGPTALYHYFESKQHCLYVIMDQAIEGFRARFEALTGDDGARPGRRARGGHRRLLRPLRARRPAQPRARRRAGPAVRPQRLAARGAGAPGGARAHARPRVRLGELPRAAMQRRRDPGERPAPARPARPRPLQQHLALVPPERDRRARPRRRLLHRAERWR